MRLFIRLFAVSLVGIISFGSMVEAAEAPTNPVSPANPSGSPLTEAHKASEKVLVLPVEVIPEGVPADPTKRCPQWEDEFAAFGLPVETFSFVAWRESRCNILAHNRTLNKNKTQDRGLLQINSGWVTVTARECASQRGDLSVLFDVRCNLAVARYLYRNGGLRHWKL